MGNQELLLDYDGCSVIINNDIDGRQISNSKSRQRQSFTSTYEIRILVSSSYMGTLSWGPYLLVEQNVGYWSVKSFWSNNLTSFKLGSYKYFRLRSFSFDSNIPILLCFSPELSLSVPDTFVRDFMINTFYVHHKPTFNVLLRLEILNPECFLI